MEVSNVLHNTASIDSCPTSPVVTEVSKKCDSISVCILGSGGVGKTAITQRYLHDTFVQNWEATIEDAYRKKVKVDSEYSILNITDTAGQEDFSSLRPQWMMEKDGYIFVYSLVDKDSLDHIYSYIELIEQVTVGLSNIPPTVFIGNKKDILDRDPDTRMVSKSDVDQLLKTFRETCDKARRVNGIQPETEPQDLYNSIHFEVSARSAERVEDTFEYLIREIRKQQRSPIIQDQGSCCVIG
mmetsp:Transcript_3747/g.3877  ORF Transcript_3747/g.3877 Transcript_3747/m.3877 type:complete len:241 (-) Transcript_3747:67-789(-)